MQDTRGNNSKGKHNMYEIGKRERLYTFIWIKVHTLSTIPKSEYGVHFFIFQQRHYFANKGLSSQGYGFPEVMYGCESWTVEKAERRRTDVFELWCWRRLLRVPWTARRSNQSILKEISPGYSLLFFFL